MKKDVTKEQFIKSLEETLKLTRLGIEKLELIGNLVLVVFENGYKKAIDIEGDSGIAIIRDVTKAI